MPIRGVPYLNFARPWEEDRNRVRRDFMALEDLIGAGAVWWDAIVDNSLSASSPTNRQFRGIGEALTYLAGIGLSSACVLVKWGTGATYTETATFSAPAGVTLIGLNAAHSAGATGVAWSIGTVALPAVVAWHFQNMNVQSGSRTVFFTTDPSQVVAWNSQFDFRFATNIMSSSNAARVWMYGCDLMGASQLGNQVHLSDCILKLNTTPTTICAGSTQLLTMLGCRIWNVDSSRTINLPTLAWLEIHDHNVARGGSGGTNQAVTLNIPSGGEAYIQSARSQSSIGVFNVTGTTSLRVVLVGTFNDVTLGVPISANAFYGHCRTLDISGPADVHCALGRVGSGGDGSNGITARGSRVRLDASMAYAGSGTAFSAVGLTDSLVNIAAVVTGAASQKSYNLDASSNRNILEFAGASNFPVAGSNAGAGNIITQT